MTAIIATGLSQPLTLWANRQDRAKRPSDTRIIDFGVDLSERDAAWFATPFAHVAQHVKPLRKAGRQESRKRQWWLHGETVPALRAAFIPLSRNVATPRVAEHRCSMRLPVMVLPDTRLYAITREDDFGFSVLSSRMREVWSLANAAMHGDGDDGGRPTYNAKSCFETLAFPAASPEHIMPISDAAKHLDDLRNRWLNPPEWTRREPEIVPLGMDHSPYRDRILPLDGFEAQLAQRTPTKLYNERPAWLAQAHAALDAAVAAAYGWADCTPAMPDEQILRRLLVLNREWAV